MRRPWLFHSLLVTILLVCAPLGDAIARVPVENSHEFERLKAITTEPTGLIFYRICKLRGAQYGESQNSNLLWVLGSNRPSFGYLFLITPEQLVLVRDFEITPNGLIGGDLGIGSELRRELDGLIGSEFGFKFRSVLSGPGALETIFADTSLDRCIPPDAGP